MSRLAHHEKETVLRKVMIFIDGSNIFHSMHEYGQKIENPDYRIDYEKLVEILKGENDLIRTSYFASSMVPPIKEQTAFYNKLKFEFRFYLHVFPIKFGKEKGVDVSLAINYLAMGLTNQFEEGILVTGDKDLATAVKFVRDRGPVTKVVSFRHSLSKDLREAADGCIYLNDIADQIEFK